MKLTTVEREKITDGMLKIQSARATLHRVDNSKIPNAEEIEACLDTADSSLREALGYARPTEQEPEPDDERDGEVEPAK